jgi:hypothetical protein
MLMCKSLALKLQVAMQQLRYPADFDSLTADRKDYFRHDYR